MSAVTEEDVELRELLVSNLEARGVLSKIKAELRAAIFQCLDEKPPTAKRSDEHRLALSVVSDSLTRLGLHNTLKVLEAESSSMLESPLMECDAIERHLNIPHSSVPVLCTLLDNKTGSSHHVKDSLNELKDKARSDFNEYVHEASNRIDVADAASALLDVLPYVPESMAKALFATRPFNDGTISFDDWWGDIEKFFTIAKHITHGTRPGAELAEITDLKLNLSEENDQARGDFHGTQQLTNRSTTAPASYTNDQFTEDFESRTQKSESEIEDEITGGQLPDSDSEQEFPLKHSAGQQNPEMTEDFSLRSDDISSKYADFLDNV